MSHFTTLVLIPKSECPTQPSETDAEALIAPRLAPFDESIEAPEYLKDCYCRGNVARREARAQAEQELGKTLDQLRAEHQELRKKTLDERLGPFPGNGTPAAQEWYAQMDVIEAELNPQWKERVQPLLDLDAKFEAAHPLKDAAAPGCEECGGTGQRATTYNPKSKWDWYVIGGRWEGALKPGYEAADDPRNYGECSLCSGTGKRNDELGLRERAQDPNYGCNGCSGTGKSRNFRNAPTNSNIADVEHVLQQKFVPFSILTPNGEWHENGSMGWWGMVSEEKARGTWETEAKQVLEANLECWAVLCDLHI